ncbi:TPA: hypothetical protein ACH3X1_003088 [Trebouxia sp. C0004]
MNGRFTNLLCVVPSRNSAARKAREWFKRSVTYSTSSTGLTMLVISAAIAVGLFATLHAVTPALSSPQILLQGRFSSDNDQSRSKLPILFSWPSSSVYVTFESDSINATLSAVTPTVSFSGYNRFSFKVDQTEQDIETHDLSKTVLYWSAAGLGSGPHTLTITKLNEAMYGEATLDAVEIEAGGRWLAPLLPTTLQSGRRIQFIGDSFAAGYANTGGSSSCNNTACTPFTCMPELDSQDATVSWGPLTAASFDADYELIAWSGSGQVTYFIPQSNAAADPEYAVVPEWIQEAQYPLISDLFTQQVAGDNTSSISNYSSWVPQVVVMAGGANDFVLPALSLQDWSVPYLNFLQTVSAFALQSHIVHHCRESLRWHERKHYTQRLLHCVLLHNWLVTQYQTASYCDHDLTSSVNVLGINVLLQVPCMQV